ncbi:hypothetical protein TeGR_g6689, partial [Tetraparma gracilis]
MVAAGKGGEDAEVALVLCEGAEKGRVDSKALDALAAAAPSPPPPHLLPLLFRALVSTGHFEGIAAALAKFEWDAETMQEPALALGDHLVATRQPRLLAPVVALLAESGLLPAFLERVSKKNARDLAHVLPVAAAVAPAKDGLTALRDFGGGLERREVVGLVGD